MAAKFIYPERGKRLKYIIFKSGMTQSSFAAKIGVSAYHLSAVINGDANLTARVAQRTVEAFPAYNFDWLMNLQDANQTKKEEIKHLIADVTPETISNQISKGTLAEWCYRLQAEVLKCI